MQQDVLNLYEANRNKHYLITGFNSQDIENKCLELGVYVNKMVQLKFKAPFSGPIAVEINEHLLSFRKNEATMILISALE